MVHDPVDDLLDQWTKARPEQDLSGLSIAVRVQTLSTEFRRHAEDALAPLDMQLWEYDVLAALRRQGAPFELAATELARETFLSTGAMTNRIDKLVDKGYVCRRPDPGDRRGVLVTLTDTGREVVDEALQARFHAANQQVHALSVDDRRRLTGLLRKLVN